MIQLLLGLAQRRSDNRAPLRHYFYIPRPRSHINLYIEYMYDFNYMKGAQRRTDVVPPLGLALLTHTHGHTPTHTDVMIKERVYDIPLNVIGDTNGSLSSLRNLPTEVCPFYYLLLIHGITNDIYCW